MILRSLVTTLLFFACIVDGAEIQHFEPEASRLYCGGGCTPPEITISIQPQAPYVYVNVSPGWNTHFWYVDSLGTQQMVNQGRFVIFDENSSVGSIWVTYHPLTPPAPAQILPLDSAVTLEAQEFYLTCYISQISGVDSLSQLFSAQVGLPVQQTETVQIPGQQLQVYPNPFNSDSRIRFVSQSASPVEIELYNILGQKLQTIYSGRIEPGTFEIPWSPSSLPAGVYFISATQDNRSRITKTLLLK